MAMGVVNDNIFEKELERLLRQPKKTIDVPTARVSHGRNLNDKNVPPTLRKIIGETNVLDSRPEAVSLARDFGISSSSVSAYANGASSTATYHKPIKNLDEYINKRKRAVSMRARGVLMNTLKVLQTRDLSEEPLRVLSGVARDMSGIVKDMEPQDKGGNTNNTQILVYKPRVSSEDEYQIINVQE